jgi:hypothetical protein
MVTNVPDGPGQHYRVPDGRQEQVNGEKRSEKEQLKSTVHCSPGAFGSFTKDSGVACLAFILFTEVNLVNGNPVFTEAPKRIGIFPD